LKIRVKRHVLSVLYSIRQQDTPKSRDSRAPDQKVGKVGKVGTLVSLVIP